MKHASPVSRRRARSPPATWVEVEWSQVSKRVECNMAETVAALLASAKAAFSLREEGYELVLLDEQGVEHLLARGALQGDVIEHGDRLKLVRAVVEHYVQQNDDEDDAPAAASVPVLAHDNEEEEEEEPRVLTGIPTQVDALNTRHVVAAAEELLTRLRDVGLTLGMSATDDLFKEVEQHIRLGKNRIYRVVFAGGIGKGKSELINRFAMGLLKGVLSEAKVPLPSAFGGASLTRHIMEVAWAPVWAVRAVHSDVTQPDMVWENFGTTDARSVTAMGELLRDFSAHYCQRRDEQLTPAALEAALAKICVSGPFPGLKDDRDIVLVDTPGFDTETPDQAHLRQHFVRYVSTANAVVVVSERVPGKDLEDLVGTGVLSRSTGPSLVIGAFFGKLENLTEDVLRRDVKSLQDKLRAAFLKHNSVSGSIKEGQHHTRRLIDSALTFYRNVSLRDAGAYFEAVRRAAAIAAMADMYTALSVLWFAASVRERALTQSGTKKKKHKAKPDDIKSKIDKMLTQLWGVTQEIKMRESQCHYAWITFVVANTAPAIHHADKTMAESAESALQAQLTMLRDELVAYGRTVTNTCAEFYGKEVHERLVLGHKGKSAVIQDEDADDDDDDDNGGSAQDGHDEGEVMRTTFRHKAAQAFDRMVDGLCKQITEQWASSKLRDQVRQYEADLESRHDSSMLALLSNYPELETWALDEFQSLVTQSSMDLVHEAVQKTMAEVHAWAKAELVNKHALVSQDASTVELRPQLQELLGEMKELFARFMLGKSKGLWLPKTSLLDDVAVLNDAPTVETIVREHLDKVNPVDDDAPVPHKVQRLTLEKVVTPERAGIMRLVWGDSDSTLRLHASSADWEQLESHAQQVAQQYRWSDAAVAEAPKLRVLSPVFCFAMPPSAADMGTNRCRDLFTGRPDDSGELDVRRLMVYVAYTAHAKRMSPVVQRSHTLLLLLPNDARPVVGQEAVKLLCEQLGLPFNWIIPSHLSSVAMFHHTVMKSRVCSPALLFYRVEREQIGPLLIQAVHAVASYAKQEAKTLLDLLMLPNSIQERDDAFKKLGLFSRQGPFGLQDVLNMLDCLERGCFADHPAAQRIVLELRRIMKPVLWTAQVQLPHGMTFLFSVLQPKSGEHGGRLFAARCASGARDYGIYLNNVIALRPSSHVSPNDELRGSRPADEDDFRACLTEGMSTLLATCAKQRGLVNYHFMWLGSLKTMAGKTPKKKKKPSAAAHTKKPKTLFDDTPVVAVPEAALPEVAFSAPHADLLYCDRQAWSAAAHDLAAFHFDATSSRSVQEPSAHWEVVYYCATPHAAGQLCGMLRKDGAVSEVWKRNGRVSADDPAPWRVLWAPPKSPK